jgi:hypothetical protein
MGPKVHKDFSLTNKMVVDTIVKFIGLPLCWYGLGKLKPEDLRRGSFQQGRNISQNFKQFFWWDTFVEPFVITQFLRVFIIGHSFVEGLASDNEDQDTIRDKLTELKEEVVEEFNEEYSSTKDEVIEDVPHPK